MTENLYIYGAVYYDAKTALSALGNFERLDKRELTGPYDAAVIYISGGLPRILKRMERPTLELIPELVARGRPPIGVLAEPLAAWETAVAVIGPPELEKGFKRVARDAFMTSARAVDSAELGAITQSA
jgi:hypothetical protein